MKKKFVLIPALSTLLLSTVVLSHNVVADEELGSLTPTSISIEASIDTITANETTASIEESTRTSTDVANTTSDDSTTTEANTGTSTSDTVTILHTNDMHGRIVEASDVIGTSKLAEVVNETRAQGTTLVFDSGDAIQGLPISNSTKGEDMVTVTNTIGYDAMTLGNHEFDFGLDQIKSLHEK